MKFFRSLLICLLAVLPGMGAHAQSATAPSVPVVQQPANGHAEKPKPKPKPVAKPAPKPAAAKPAPPPAPAVPEPAAAPTPAPTPAPPAANAGKGGVSGLPVPRFASLRYDDVNLRVGPSTNYPIDWVYRRRDLPVEILLELGDWRKVRDQDGIIGWMRAQTLWARRSVVVRGGERALRSSADDHASPVAQLKPGVIGHLLHCPAAGDWCEIEVSGYRGWMRRGEVYGVYPNEAIEG